VTEKAQSPSPGPGAPPVPIPAPTGRPMSAGGIVSLATTAPPDQPWSSVALDLAAIAAGAPGAASDPSLRQPSGVILTTR
jgi:hypothetical protein